MLPPEMVKAPVMLIVSPVVQLNGRLLVLCVSAPALVHVTLEFIVRKLLASSNPLSVKLAMLALALTVIVQAAGHEVASIVIESDDVGTAQPPAPFDAPAHLAVSFQFP